MAVRTDGFLGTRVGAPTFDTGPGVAVPLVSTALTALGVTLVGAHFTNSAAVTRKITVTDTAGNTLCQLDLPPGGEQPYPWPNRPATGVKWVADGASVTGHIWGFLL